MPPPTAQRVARVTPEHLNRRIAREAEERVRRCAAEPALLDRRLRQLDAEWDIERSLAANAATLALAGTLLGALVDKRWLVVPGVVTGFLLQHAVQGWCPPLPLFRRLGVRTAEEIGQERRALKALRGDFAPVADRAGAPAEERAERALRAARA